LIAVRQRHRGNHHRRTDSYQDRRSHDYLLTSEKQADAVVPIAIYQHCGNPVEVLILVLKTGNRTADLLGLVRQSRISAVAGADIDAGSSLPADSAQARGGSPATRAALDRPRSRLPPAYSAASRYDRLGAASAS
jgi:hypothetical protein